MEDYKLIDELIEAVRQRPESCTGGDFAHAVDPFGFGRLLLHEASQRIEELECTRSKLIEGLSARDRLFDHMEADNERLRNLLLTPNAKVTGAAPEKG